MRWKKGVLTLGPYRFEVRRRQAGGHSWLAYYRGSLCGGGRAYRLKDARAAAIRSGEFDAFWRVVLEHDQQNKAKTSEAA